MKVTLCGVRGSTPAAGSEFARYGGNTPCVALSRDGGSPTLVLDAGTGIRKVSGILDGPFRGTVLLSHLHWDHIEGLPFFNAADREGATTTILMPAQGGDPERLMARMMGPPFFPVLPEELDGTWRFEELEEGEHNVEGFDILAREIPHKGSRTFGYRISDGDRSLTYVPDHSPISSGPGRSGLGEYHEAILTLAQGADVLLHDAQHTADEFAAVSGFGHSTIEYAIALAEEAQVRTLILFHHAPTRTDEDVDEIMERLPPSKVEIRAAAEGWTFTL